MQEAAVATRPMTGRVQKVRTRWFLEGLLLLGVLVGALAFHILPHERSGLLYWFFVPVSICSVVLGHRVGMVYAGISALVVLLQVLPYSLSPAPWPGLSEIDLAILISMWVGILFVTAYAVGRVSERGGNRALLQGMGAECIEAVERERKRMGFDLHDGIAQVATTAVMEVEVLQALTEDSDPVVREEVDRLKEICGEAVREIRTMIGQLRPPQLSGEEFDATVYHLISEFRERTGVKTELELQGDLSCHTDSMRICVYRVVQEALSNIERHSRASRARAGIRATKGGVFLTVSDDGEGFDPVTHVGSNKSDGHFGLEGMRQRVRLLSGEIDIDSAPGRGTVVRAHIPARRAPVHG